MAYRRFVLPTDKLPEIKYATPSSCGWVRVPDKPRTWETPDGKLYIFPPEGAEVVAIMPRLGRRGSED